MKNKLPASTLLNRPIIQLKEKPISQQSQNLVQPKITLKVLAPESYQILNTELSQYQIM